MGTSAEDRATKRERVRELMLARGLDALALTTHESIAWYLEGVRTHVSLAGPPVLAVCVRPDADELFVSANEADRLIAEELLAEDAAVIRRVPWDRPVAAEVPGTAETHVAAELRAARASLLPAEYARFTELGGEVASVMTDALVIATPQTEERELSADVAQRLHLRGIDPLVVLVAGHERLSFRHPLPTRAPLGDRAMLVVCGRRHGLIANATRWISTPEAAAAVADADTRILEVEAAFFRATRPGTRLDEVFAEGCAAYASHGFAPEEWQAHHQGGAAGYAGRDPRATTATTDVVRPMQAFAWNPTAPGVKVEDTVVISADGVEVLTVDTRWPSREVARVTRPTHLVFGASV